MNDGPCVFGASPACLGGLARQEVPLMYVPSGRREKQQGYGHVRFRHPWAAGERTLLHAAGRHADRVQFRAGHERFRGRGHPVRHRPRVAGLRGHGRQSGVAVRHPSDVDRRVPRRQHPVCARAELRGAAALQPHGEGRFSAAVPHAGRQWLSQCLASPNHPR